MAEPLTPEEIDALLNSLKESAAAPVDAPAPEPEPEVTAPAMPFGELSRETADKLTVVAESLKSGLEKHLKPILQLPFTIRVTQIGLARSLKTPLTLLKFNPSESVGALDFDNNLATAMADRLMGGQARPASRPAGDLERAILTPVFQAFSLSLNHALRHQGTFVTIFHDEDTRSDSTLQATLEFDLSGLRGAVRVLLPNLFTAHTETEAPVTKQETDWVIELGKAEISAHALIDLKVGEIIKLDRHADANLVLKTGEIEFIGRPVLDGDRLLFAIANARPEVN